MLLDFTAVRELEKKIAVAGTVLLVDKTVSSEKLSSL